MLPLLVSPEWVEERKLRWRVTSPIYQSKVLGEFPDVSDDTLIQPKWIEAAQKRSMERTRRPIIAADIARVGEERDRDHAQRRRLGQDISSAPQGRQNDDRWPHCQGNVRHR